MTQLFALVLLITSSSLTAQDFSGEWEVQSMGNDREIIIQQNGDEIVAHRIMWPTFEGQRYKLEHLYRGTISGNTISGNLLVKDDEVPDYEVLRAFKATLLGNAAMDFDNLKLRRTHKEKSSTAQPLPPQAPVARAPAPLTPVAALPSMNDSGLPPPPPPPPSLAQAASPPPDPPRAYTPPAQKQGDSSLPPVPPSAPETRASGGLFGQIIATTPMGDLFALAARVNMPHHAKLMADQADIHFENKRYRKALEAYRDAAKIVGGSNIDFDYQIGRCHLELKEYGAALRILRKVARLDPFNAPARAEYQRAVKYLKANTGR